MSTFKWITKASTIKWINTVLILGLMLLNVPPDLYALAPAQQTAQPQIQIATTQPIIDPVTVITSQDERVHNTTEGELFGQLNTQQLLEAARKLEEFRRTTTNLYQKIIELRKSNRNTASCMINWFHATPWNPDRA